MSKPVLCKTCGKPFLDPGHADGPCGPEGLDPALVGAWPGYDDPLEGVPAGRGERRRAATERGWAE